MHFGLYLKNKGIISAEQLVAAMEKQLNNVVPIGQLALEEGVLSARDIFTVLHAQSDSPTERFGELAVDMGMMTRDELMRLLMVQADRRRPLADILVEQGTLLEQQVAAEMAAFRNARLQPQRAKATFKVVPSPRRQDARMTSDELITV